jgi:DNA repair exonuclease SbcCD nuclease subunit
MKLVHAADIHLDSPLRGLERYEGAPVEEIRGATRRAVENLVDLCLVEAASLLLIAGDLYDGDWRDYNTGLFFAKQMARLTREGVRVVWIRGNHDAASQITKSLRLSEGVTELGASRPETVVFEDLGVAVHGQSYPRRDVTDDLAAGYPDARSSLFNVGLLHTALDGREGHDAYAPSSVDRLSSRGYQYWALGHVHRREVVCEDPWIVFPGNLQARHARETGAKGATIIHVEDGNVASVEPRPLDVVRWSVCNVDVSGASSLHDAVDLARAAVEVEAGAIDDRTLAVRIQVVGRSAAHAALRAEQERFQQEIRAGVLDASAPVWVEKILVDTRAAGDDEVAGGIGGPIGDLLTSIRSLRTDPQGLAELARELGPLGAKLPAEYRALPGALDLENPEALVGLLADVEQDLVPRLLASGEES